MVGQKVVIYPSSFCWCEPVFGGIYWGWRGRGSSCCNGIWKALVHSKDIWWHAFLKKWPKMVHLLNDCRLLPGSYLRQLCTSILTCFFCLSSVTIELGSLPDFDEQQGRRFAPVILVQTEKELMLIYMALLLYMKKKVIIVLLKMII